MKNFNQNFNGNKIILHVWANVEEVPFTLDYVYKTLRRKDLKRIIIKEINKNEIVYVCHKSITLNSANFFSEFFSDSNFSFYLVITLSKNIFLTKNNPLENDLQISELISSNSSEYSFKEIMEFNKTEIEESYTRSFYVNKRNVIAVIEYKTKEKGYFYEIKVRPNFSFYVRSVPNEISCLI